ncbi:MAG: low molecular weight protein-tyrosine-phosphatase [Chitinophagaceae bacterium]
MKILMVCLGNICRSPLAEGILQNKAGEIGLEWIVESAGTNGYHDGEPPHPLSKKIALENGIDIGHQRSRKFRADDFDKYDVIYAMAKDVIEDIKEIAQQEYNPKKVRLLMDDLYPGTNKDVPDPWSKPASAYHEVYKMMEEACEAIVSKELNNKQPAKGKLQETNLQKT